VVWREHHINLLTSRNLCLRRDALIGYGAGPVSVLAEGMLRVSTFARPALREDGEPLDIVQFEPGAGVLVE